MIDIPTLKSGLVKAHKAGDTAAAQKFANAIRQMQQAQQTEPEQFTGQGFAEQFNKNVASTLGAPVDLVSAGLGAISPALRSQEPFGGSASIRRGMQNLGIATASPEDKAETFGERVGDITGQVASLAVPVGAGLSAAARGGRFAPEAQRRLTQLAQNPRALSTLEALGIGGAAGGGYLAQEGGADELGQIAGEVVGGIAAPIAATMPVARAVGSGLRFVGEKAGIIGTGADGVAGLPGAERAAKRLQALVPDAEEARRALNAPTEADMTPAQRIGAPELLAVERGAAGRTAATRQEFDSQNAANLQELRAEIEPVASPEAVRVYLQARADRLTDGLKNRVAEAATRAEERLAAVTPTMRRSEASEVMANEIDKVYSTAKQTESQLWGNVPDVALPTGGLKQRYNELLASVPVAQREDVPAVAGRLLSDNGMLGEVESLKELQGFRSKLLEESRISRATGNYNKARLADELADATLDAMGARTGAEVGEAGVALREALDYSRYINQTFRQGEVGRLLGSDRTGAARVAPQLAAQAIVGSGGERGFVGAQRGLRAAPTEEMRGALQQTLLDSLEKTAVRDGELNPAGAERWLRQNRDNLDGFPEMAEQVKQAIRTQNTAKGAALTERTIGKNLTSAQKSVTARYLGADVGREVDRILTAQNPQQAARQIGLLVRKDKEAVEGLRAATFENLLRKSGSGDVNDFGLEVVSGKKLLSNLRDKRTRDAYVELMGIDGYSRAESVAKDMAKIEASQTVAPAKRIMDDVYSSILKAPAAILGADVGRRIGGALGGGTIQTPGKLSGLAQRFVDRMTVDKGEELLIQALNDKSLMDALLQDITTRKGAREAQRKLNLWITSPAGKLFVQQEQEEEGQ